MPNSFFTSHAVMSRRLLPAIAALLLASNGSAAVRAPDMNEESHWLQVLQSNLPVEEKERACVALHRVGTARSVPALAALLGDARLSHGARYALETMPAPAAGRALIDALATTAGTERVGIINSLAVRKETAAAPALGRLLATLVHDGTTAGREGPEERRALASFVAAALGEIDHREALASLELAWNAPNGPLHAGVGDGLLRHAQRKLAGGDRREARRLFEQVYQRAPEEHLRMAAWQGMTLASGNDSVRLLTAALAGPTAAEQEAALRLVPDLTAPGVGPALAKLLPTLPPPRQVALLNCWLQRPEPPPLATLRPLLDSPQPELKVAAIHALGSAGDDSVVMPLVAAAAESGPAQPAARLALTRISRGDVTGRLLALLGDPRPEVRVEVARALGERGEKRAVVKLLETARSESAPVRQAALRALVVLVEERQFASLIRLVTQATSAVTRDEAARALTLAYERLQPRQGSAALRPLLAALKNGTLENRVALLPVCGTAATAETREALRAALRDPSPEIRGAAARAVSRTADAELLPDLTRLAGEGADEEIRDLATQACVRLTTAAPGRFTPAARMAIFHSIAAKPLSLVQKRALLNGVSAGRTLAELELAESLLGDEAARPEAGAAVLNIAPRLADAARAGAALRRLGEVAGVPEMRKKAAAALAAVETRADYVTSWQTAPPFPGKGRTAADWIDEVFAPETKWRDLRAVATRSALARWAPMAVGSEARSPMNLRGGSPAASGAAYAFTWVRLPRQQNLRLEIRHDQAMKAWLNGHLVLAGASQGSLQPKTEPDRVSVVLEAGWNLLLLKVAQPAASWAFSVRLRNPEGTLPEGLVADAEAEP